MYIKIVIDENKNSYISFWLLLITLLIGLMIIVGGLTRLTDSGLSITRWDLFTGIIPPLSTSDWESAFDLYKEIPEYKLQNFSMSLSEFKVIYWWEFVHRLLGRVVGLLYLLPLLYFTFKKWIRGKTLIFLYTIFSLILLQGFIGWYMVKSGLTDRTDVSHYRLSLHLTLAFFIYILSFWNYLKYTKKNNLAQTHKFSNFLLIIFLFSIILQISVGALVSGLDAGQIYNTWPLMNNRYFPDDSSLKDLFSIQALETPSIVQFLHRNLAYFIILLFSFISTIIYSNENFTYLRNTTLLIFLFLILQTVLGVLTILSGAQIALASMHQIGSIFLITSSLILVFKNSRIN